MDNVNKTLYIPLYGKAFVSKRGILLRDPDAERIWDAAGFPLKGKAASKWLAYNMGMRSAVFDNWLRAKIAWIPCCVNHASKSRMASPRAQSMGLTGVSM